MIDILMEIPNSHILMYSQRWIGFCHDNCIRYHWGKRKKFAVFGSNIRTVTPHSDILFNYDDIKEKYRFTFPLKFIF